MKVLGVIPARGGSKGVPNKNIKILGEIPLIAFSIREAIKSKLLTKIIVSSDSTEIIEVAKNYGAEVPFIRPDHLATDSALSKDVTLHALDYFKKKGEDFDIVVLLQPTTPFRKATDIDKSIQLIMDGKADSVFSLVDVGANHPARMYQIDSEGTPSSLFDEGVAMRPRQELQSTYIRSGDIYAIKSSVLRETNSLIGKKPKALVVEPDLNVNIDSVLDFKIAELKLKEN